MGGPGQGWGSARPLAPPPPQGYASESTSSSECYWNIGFGQVQETKVWTLPAGSPVRSDLQ